MRELLQLAIVFFIVVLIGSVLIYGASTKESE